MLLTTAILALAPGLAAPEAPTLNWFDGSLSKAVATARDQDQMVVLYFWRNDSEYCAKLYQETLLSEDAGKAFSNSLLVSAQWDDAKGAQLMEQFSVRTLPTMLFLNSEGKPEDAIAGFIPGADLVREVARIERGEGTLSDLERKAAVKHEQLEEGFEANFALAGKCQELGQQERHDELMASIREADPRRVTVIGARAYLWDIQANINKHASEAAGHPDGDGGDDAKREAILAKYDLDPLYKHAKLVKAAESRYDAWNSIANLEAVVGKHDRACKALASAAKYVSDDNAIGFYVQSAGWILEMEEGRGKKEAMLALDFAERGYELAVAHAASSEEVDHPGAYEAWALSVLARANYEAGKENKALEQVERCMELYPDGEYEALLERMKNESA